MAQSKRELKKEEGELSKPKPARKKKKEEKERNKDGLKPGQACTGRKKPGPSHP